MVIIEPEFLEITAGLDTQAFWDENRACLGYTPQKPRCAVHLSLDDHWIFEFMQIPSTLRYSQDKRYRDQLHCQVSHITQNYLGYSHFEEHTWEHSPKRIEKIVELNRILREFSQNIQQGWGIQHGLRIK